MIPVTLIENNFNHIGDKTTTSASHDLMTPLLIKGSVLMKSGNFHDSYSFISQSKIAKLAKKTDDLIPIYSQIIQNEDTIQSLLFI